VVTDHQQSAGKSAASGRRLSVCYVAPGQNLLATAGPTRNVLNLATALARYAHVTVAFRRVTDHGACPAVEVLEIDMPRRAQGKSVPDDAAVRGVGIAEFARYAFAIKRFVRRDLEGFDLVFEKSWTLSGLVASECRKLGIPALVIENLVPVLGGKTPAESGTIKRAKLWAGRALAGRYLRNADRIIAETQVLKSAMVSHWRIPEHRISVVALGVDRDLFRPSDQLAARRNLGISPSATVLLYSGVIDQTHNLRPVTAALGGVKMRDTELHIIGDGVLRAELEQLAAEQGSPVRFHGRVPYERVPEYIAAADLCLAPYEPDAFPGGVVAYSSLKIPEYMSVGRPVVSVPSGRVLELVDDGETGFLFANNEREWLHFLQNVPDRERLSAMGEAALESELDSWDDVARAYLNIGQAEIDAHQHVGS
jgi:glycosyltransferase involved in cell wall biosynthesis